MLGNVAYAATPCNGFEIKIRNNLSEYLVASKANIDGADLHPSGLQKLKPNSEKTFTVSNSLENKKMAGEFVFHTSTLPTKKVTIKFTLDNAKTVYCEHEDESPEGDYPLNKTRMPGKVDYTIG